MALVCVSVPLQIIISDILSIYVFFLILGNRKQFMLANIRISTIYNSLTVFIVFFFTILSWYSKVRDRESLLFQLATNRN